MTEKHDWEFTRSEYAVLVRDGKRDFACLGNTGRTGAFLARILATAEQDGHNLDLAREMFARAVLQACGRAAEDARKNRMEWEVA